jgi:hypothetical protein
MSINLTRSRPSGWLLFAVSGLIWLVYNVGGNWVGLDFVLDWLEARNGAMSLPALLHTDYAQLAIAILASSGQAWLQSSESARANFWLARILIGIMAADFALNLVGAYVYVMPAAWPPDLSVLLFLAALTLVCNILLQSVAHQTLIELTRPAQPREIPVAPSPNSPPLVMTPRRKATRRTL